MSKIMQQFKAAKLLTVAIKKTMGPHWSIEKTTVRNIAILVEKVELQEIQLNALRG